MIGKMLSGFGNLLDLPGSKARDALALQNPFDQVATPFSDQNRTSGRDLLRQYGMAGNQDNWGNYLGGMAVETLTDPTNLIPVGMLAKYTKGLSKAKTANKAIDAGNALSLQQRAMGFMPEEIAGLTKIAGPEGPTRMYHGTHAAFDQYDMNKMDSDALYGKGIYTTDNPSVGSSYVDKSGIAYTLDKDKAKEILDRYNQGDLEYAKFHLQNARVPDPSVIRRDMQYAGVPTDLLDQATPPAPKNVRTQFLDIRNPLDIQATYGTGGIPLPPELAAKSIAKQRGKLRELTHRIRWARDKAASGETRSPGRGSWPDRVQELEGLLRDQFANRHKVPTMSGNDIFHAQRGKLQELGFDGITHLGGKNTPGGVAHNVAIAFDPSQVYKPYIAKSLRERMAKPKAPVKSLGAFTAYNLSRGGRE